MIKKFADAAQEKNQSNGSAVQDAAVSHEVLSSPSTNNNKL